MASLCRPAGDVPPRLSGMCGIVGYVGDKQAQDVVVEGLRRLEYRGYDSAGIALVTDGHVAWRKRAGKLANLEKALADGRRAGINISDEIAWEWLSRNPAKAMGILDKTGTLAPGKMADVVLWNGNPFSDYTRPERVWIDGALMYDANDPKRRPVSDFELGQPGEGDTK